MQETLELILQEIREVKTKVDTEQHMKRRMRISIIVR